MKQLKFEPVNGYGVLVDEKCKIEDFYPCLNLAHKQIVIPTDLEWANSNHDNLKKIIFAEKELNLEGVPVFEWRDFEVSNKAYNWLYDNEENIPKGYPLKPIEYGFIQGYKSNPAKYTEEDFLKFLETFTEHAPIHYIKSELRKGLGHRMNLQKYPKHVVMETEIVDFSAPDRIYYDYKLFTNSEGMQQGIVKELIW